MLHTIRYFLSDVGHWIVQHKLIAGVAVLVLAAAGVGGYLLATRDSSTNVISEAPAPRVVVRATPAAEDAGDLGFPAFATKNTTRVAGSDAVGDAAGVALAVYPSTGGVPGPNAVTLVDAGDWQGGVAAASLAAAPVGAPLLVTESGEIPDLTASALRSLDPQGSADTAGRQVFVVGAAAKPDGFESLDLEGSSPAEVAAQVDRLRQRLDGDPEHIVLASTDEPAYAMPAAAWAARSGDPVLFVQRDTVPKPTVKALRSHERVPIFVLGPESAISAEAMKQIKKVSPSVERVGADGAEESSIAFARFVSGSFGWNINDPGHGFVVANSTRPLDAAAAAPLSASGTWGPLLVTNEAGAVPTSLRGYLLDLKPGYASDPTRAVYNHVWLIGDTSAISVAFQAQADELAEVAPVTSGSGSSSLGPAPGAPESAPVEQPTPDHSSGNTQNPDQNQGSP